MNDINNNFLKHLSILYVEDNSSIQEEVVYFLKNRVSKLFIASNGEEGLKLFKEKKPNLIVTDISMPILDGIEMSKKIRFFDKEIPIIVVSAYNDSEYLTDAIDIGIVNFLMKPLNLFKLNEILEKISKNMKIEKENKQMKLLLEQYKSIADEREIISIIDLNKKIIYANQPFIKISGYKKEDLLGQNYQFLQDNNQDKEQYIKIWNTINNEKKIWRGVLKNENKNNKIYYLDTLIKPIFDDEENIKEFIAMSHDITSLEKTKIFLKNKNTQQSSNLNDALFNLEQYEKGINANNIVSRTDTKGMITYVNEEFIKTSGYTKKELLGKSNNILRHKDMEKQIFKNLWFTIKNGKIWKGVIKNRNKLGNSYYVNSVILPIFNTKNKIVEYLSITHDITQTINLNKELEYGQREIIYKMGEICETRSQETGYHVKRVAQYSKLLAKLYGLKPYDIKLLFIASPMHDIGKVGISDKILNKTTKLNLEEWEIMKTHSNIGYKILKDSNREFLKAAAIVAYEHHEKWDGSGYPRGLKETSIHIYGRITAFADVFDALGSNRCYKKSWTLDKICKYMQNEKGKQFEPKIIDLFFDNMEEFVKIRNKYID